MTSNPQVRPPESADTPDRPLSRSLSLVLEASSEKLLIWAVILSLAIVLLDALLYDNISMGILYIIPMLLSAPALKRWQVVLLALCFSTMREHFAPFGWNQDSILRVAYAFISFVGAGLFAGEVVRGRRMALQHSREMREQMELRREAEDQLRTLIESSPAAIITLDAEGRIDLANQAAHELLVVPPGELSGSMVRDYLPVMADVLQASVGDVPYRTTTTGRGHRADGESFLACVWFATYQTRAGKRLAAIITDSSEDLRNWQETSLQSLLTSTRVLVGSVSHEIRNICAAISVVHANLGRIEGVARTEDYEALGTLSQGLARLATVELQSSGEQETGIVNLEGLLEEFRIVVAPALEAAEVELSIEAPRDLPLVLGDHHGLLQVLLNLSRNSLRAMENSVNRRVAVRAVSDSSDVVVRVSDSGAGVPHPERLFQPFQPGADAVGLGLFVSRAIVRACNGELYHEPSPEGCTMCLKLKPYLAAEASGEVQTTEIPA